MINRQPSKLGCLRVDVRFPSTRANNIGAKPPMNTNEPPMNTNEHECRGTRCSALQEKAICCHSCSFVSIGGLFPSLINPQITHHPAAPPREKGVGISTPFSGGCRNRVAQIPSPPQPQPRH